jgi:CheY-like chemotaxis protein
MMADKRLLIVEDDTNSQKITKILLENSGITIDIAINAEQALEFLDNCTYPVIIIDLSLPGMSGWELLSRIQKDKHSATTKCIAMTAFHSPNVSQEALKAGFVAYFPKPLEVRTFAHSLTQYFDS